MSVISNNILAGSSGQGGGGAAGYAIDRSLRFNNADSSNLSRTPTAVGNRKTWTLSTWIKKCAESSDAAIMGATGTPSRTACTHYFGQFYIYSNTGIVVRTTGEFRDPSAWYHVVFVLDTTQATAADRTKIYVNGEQPPLTYQTSPGQNTEWTFNNTGLHEIGKDPTANEALSGYLADVHFIDGQALAATDFGEYDDNNVWQPKEYAGTYGTNGFHLDFSDTSSDAALGTDTSGNSNTWTVNNLSVAAGAGNDSLRDSPSQIADQTDTGVGGEVVGNYATWNPNGSNDSYITYSNGNLDFTQTAASGQPGQMAPQATIGVSSGKWYWEFVNTSGTNLGASVAGTFSEENSHLPSSGHVTYYGADGSILGSGFTLPSTASTYGVNDIIGVALDADIGSVQFFKNGVSQGTATNGPTNVNLFPSNRIWSSGASGAASVNFGQRAFAYTAPSGYKALCTANLPDPTIADGSTAFDTKLWTGNGSTQTVSGLNFSPDFLWYKSRSVAHHHGLQNTVTGVGKSLSSSKTAAEYTETTGLDAFTSDGFNLDGDGYYSINRSGHSMVGWAWDAGSSNTTIAAGGLNSSLYDQSQTWSNFVTGTAYSGYPITNAFNGDTSTRSLESGSTGHTFTPPSALTVNSTLRVYLQYANSSATNALKVNGIDKSSLITTTGSNLGWLTIPGITSITSLFWGVSPAGAETCSISAIEVDGKILVDSGVSLANVPSIASTYRANPSAGFSIVKYTGDATIGRTIAHGLNAVPEFIIGKNTDSSINWSVYTKTVGAGNSLALNDSGSPSGGTGIWGNVTPTSQVFTVGGDGNMNGNGNDMIAYCFAPVEGYSAMGSYTGNGSADGPFVFLGFRPAFLLVKNTASGLQWPMFDSTRFDYNGPNNPTVYANSSGAETANTDNYGDFLSNGFKPRGTNGNWNASGATYIYYAVAEHPFKTSRAR